jgi:hypothetical protein
MMSAKVSEVRTASNFTVGPEDEDSMYLRIVGNIARIHMVLATHEDNIFNNYRFLRLFNGSVSTK